MQWTTEIITQFSYISNKYLMTIRKDDKSDDDSDFETLPSWRASAVTVIGDDAEPGSSESSRL